MSNGNRAGLLALSLAGAAFALPTLLPLAAQESTPAVDLRKERDGSFTYKDPRLTTEGKRGWRMFISRRNTAFEGPENDPKTNVKYQFRLQVQVLSESVDPNSEREEKSERRFVVHFQRTQDEGLARLVGRVAARLHWFNREYLGRGSTGNNYINIWLSPDGKAGAEEYKANIYLHGIDEDRAPAEWVREIAHEYSHIFLPPAGRFTAPEPFANGYLGERLFMKWLLVDNDQTDLWDKPIDGAAYLANQIIPLRNKFLDEGPASPAAQSMEKEGMDYFIGQMMAIEAMYGPEIVKGILNNFNTPRPQNLGSYFTMMLRDMKPAAYSIAPNSFIPSKSQKVNSTDSTAPRFTKATYWVFLPGCDWLIDVHGQLPPNTTAQLEAAQLKNGRPGAGAMTTWETSLTSFNGVWRRLEFSAPGGAPMQIQSIQLTKKDPLAGPDGRPRIQPNRPGGVRPPVRPAPPVPNEM